SMHCFLVGVRPINGILKWFVVQLEQLVRCHICFKNCPLRFKHYLIVGGGRCYSTGTREVWISTTGNPAIGRFSLLEMKLKVLTRHWLSVTKECGYVVIQHNRVLKASMQ